MADISTIESRLKSLRSEVEAAGFSIVGMSGQLAKSAERRELEAMPSLAVLQGEMKRAMDQNKQASPAGANRVFQITQKIARRRELEKKFDKSKFIAKADDLLAKLSIIQNDYDSIMGSRRMAETEGRSLSEKARKVEQERSHLANQYRELQLRQKEIRTGDDYRRVVDDSKRLGQQLHSFSAEQEETKSKIRQFTSRFEQVAGIPPQTILRVKTELDLIKKSLEQAKLGR